MLDIRNHYSYYHGISFPHYEGKDCSGATSTDGTAFKATLINDGMWGWQQALLHHEGMFPNGRPEKAGDSQVLEAIQNLLPPGTIIEWNLNVDPAEFGARYILLNGYEIDVANYPDLVANTWVGSDLNDDLDVPAYYRFDKNEKNQEVRSNTGSKFKLPDARGCTTRGQDKAGTKDPDGAGRKLGHIQNDAMQRITGSCIPFAAGPNAYGQYLQGTSSLAGAFIPGYKYGSTLLSTTLASGVERYTLKLDSTFSNYPYKAKTHNKETRMANRCTQFAIRY